MLARISRQLALHALLFACGLPLVAPAHAQAAKNAMGIPPANIDKMNNLLQATGFPYRTTNSPTVWVVHFNGAHLKDIRVILALDPDPDSEIIIFVTVAEKRRMPATADFRYKLLKMNHEYDLVRVGLDHDDDLSVRTDASLRVADATYLRNLVDQVKRASDEIYGQIEGDLQP